MHTRTMSQTPNVEVRTMHILPDFLCNVANARMLREAKKNIDSHQRALERYL